MSTQQDACFFALRIHAFEQPFPSIQIQHIKYSISKTASEEAALILIY